MGRRKPRGKTAEDLQTERVTAALEETDRTGRAPASVRESPGQFLRDMYDVWHRQGGKEGGRWRNSIRKMRDEWLTGRNAVPSLHPKLMGRVKVTRSDARSLIDLFLTRWRYGEGDDALSSMTRDGYVGFPIVDRKRLRDLLVLVLFKANDQRSTLALPKHVIGYDTQEETRRRWIDIEKILYECDALITLSRHKIAVGPGPWQTIGRVWHMFNHLYEHDQRNDFPGRLLIWVIDLGSREVEQSEAFEEYFNAGLLALQLASFANFDTVKEDDTHPIPLLPRLTIAESARRDELWRWLVERTVIVIQNLRLEEINSLNLEEEKHFQNIRLKDIGVTPEHVLPSTTPRAWGRELRHLYGKEISASDATFTVFMRNEPWLVAGQPRSIRYFAHTPLKPSNSQKASGQADWTTNSEELRSPDRKYDMAFRLVHLAARNRLKVDAPVANEVGWEAIAYLRRIGFTVTDLPSFLRIFSGFGL